MIVAKFVQTWIDINSKNWRFSGLPGESNLGIVWRPVPDWFVLTLLCIQLPPFFIRFPLHVGAPLPCSAGDQNTWGEMLCWLVLAALDDKVVVDWHASWRIAMFSSPLAEVYDLVMIPPVLQVAAFWTPVSFLEKPCNFLVVSMTVDADVGLECWYVMVITWLFESWTQKKGL